MNHNEGFVTYITQTKYAIPTFTVLYKMKR